MAPKNPEAQEGKERAKRGFGFGYAAMTLRKRILLMHIPLLVLLVTIGSAGVVLIYRLGTRADAMLRENYDSVRAMERLDEALERIDDSFQLTLAGREAKAEYQANWAVYREHLRSAQENITLVGENTLVAELSALTERYQQQGDAFYALAADDPRRIADYFNADGLSATFTQIKSVADRISRMNQHSMEAVSRDARRTAVLSLVGFAIGVAACLALAAFAAWYTAHAVLDPIRVVTRSAQSISASDFDQVVPYLSRDVLGQLAEAFDHLTRRLREQEATRQRADELVQTTEALRNEISEREQMERELRRSEENLKRAQAVAHIGSWYLDVACDELRWSDETYRIFGVPRGAPLTYEKFLSIVHPEDRGFVEQAWQAAMRGAPYDIEHRIQVAGGTRWIREKAEITLGSDGRVIQGVGIAHDITESKQAEEQLRRSNRALVALSSCNQTLIRATDETALLQEICQIVIEKTGYRLCWVGYAEQDGAKTVRPVAQAGLEEGYLKMVNVTWADTERGHGPAGTCIRTGQPSLFKNIASDPRFAPWRAEAQQRGYASCLGIPLVAESDVLGALTIYASEADAFSDEEVALLIELANDLAFGVMALRTKAERKKAVEIQAAHEREIKIGSEIQQTLLIAPPPRDLCGLRVAALSAASKQIDGDFYYFYKHGDQCVDLVVADVMGKGIPAALLGAAAKSHCLEALCHLLHASPPGRLPPPQEIVTLAHAVMVQHLIDLESFVTLCYVRIDSERRAVEFVDAGHTGLIHRSAATGRVDALHGDDLPLGIRIGEIYNQQTLSFEAGDLLVLYSDGITEARNPAGELFGTDRLIQCIQRNSAFEPADLVQAIRRAVFAFTESELPTDDLTCVVVTMTGSERPQVRASLEIRSDFQELARVREFVRAFCDFPGAEFDEEYVGQIELAVTEACSNIIRHAYHGRIDQPIHLEAEVFPDRIALLLRHLGDSFDPSSALPPRLDGSQESGFGVYLIAHSVDEVHYCRDELGRNCIALTKNR